MTSEILRNEPAGCGNWMLVDDNPEILRLLGEAVVNLFGVAVSAYLVPADALAAFRAAPERFQCVITDLEMPGMNGFELCDRLRAISPRTKVLLATGSQHVTAAEAGAKGFCGMLTKPFSLATLRREAGSLRAGG